MTENNCASGSPAQPGGCCGAGGAPSAESAQNAPADNLKTYVLGGGCFWCLDAAFKALRGVVSVECGYAGGSDSGAVSYEQVCTGNTGHAEVVRLVFDPLEIGSDVILDAFFTMHDPRQLNRQGNDVGTQYRSIMLYADEQQRREFAAAAKRAELVWDGEVVTAIEPLTRFYVAEEKHQDFFKKNPTQAYCLAVTLPKVNKVRAVFAEYLR